MSRSSPIRRCARVEAWQPTTTDILLRAGTRPSTGPEGASFAPFRCGSDTVTLDLVDDAASTFAAEALCPELDGWVTLQQVDQLFGAWLRSNRVRCVLPRRTVHDALDRLLGPRSNQGRDRVGWTGWVAAPTSHP